MRGDRSAGAGHSALRAGSHDPVSLASVLVLLGVFPIVAGPAGLLAGFATALLWLVVGVPYAIAIGHVALIGLFPGGIDFVTFVIVEFAFVVVLFAHARTVPTPVRFSFVALVGALTLGGLAWIVYAYTHSPYAIWAAAGSLLAGFGCFGYGIHRYERVTHDLSASSTPVTAGKNQSG